MKRRLLAGFVFFVLLLILFSYLFFFSGRNIKTCNDETPYNECSKIKPYFCSEEGLRENASFCGCENISKANKDSCVSEFQINPKNITLNYVLRGKEGEINFTVYKKLADYLSEVPRYINSSENPTLLDFRLKTLNEENQKELLLPLVIQIENLTRDKTDQARIAISIVQNIPFGNSTRSLKIGNTETEYYRYPYEVLYDMSGICSEKSGLLVFLLREIGYGTAFLYYNSENHEAAGIECLDERSPSGYCFIETTGPSIITDDRTDYFGATRQLNSNPQIMITSDGIVLEKNLYEYRDAKSLINIRETMKTYGTINFIQHLQFRKLKKKYGLVSFNNSYSF